MAKIATPTALKIKNGGRKRNPYGGVEPTPKLEDDVLTYVPQYLSEHAKSAWRYVAKYLKAADMVTKVDMLALELLCEAYAEKMKARAELKKQGYFYETVGRSGTKMHRQSPA